MMHKTFLAVLLGMTTYLTASCVLADGPQVVTVKALMIQAQNESAPIDRRLEQVEFKLRRVFGFQFYKYVAEGSITLSPGAQGTIALDNGHRLVVQLAGGSRNKAEVRWFQDQRPLLSTSVKLSRDGPLVLGGVPVDGGKLIVVLTAQ